MHRNNYYEKNKIDDNLKNHDIKIAYPSHWFAPVRLSPFAKTIEEETIAWQPKLYGSTKAI